MKRKLFFSFCFLFVLLVCALFTNVLFFESKQMNIPEKKVKFEVKPAIHRLSRAIQFQTVTFMNKPLATTEYDKFHQFLKNSYPHVFQKMKLTVLNKSLLLFWKGKSKKKPFLLLAHQDVVPVSEEQKKHWKYPPFKGVVKEGYIWGRGSMDDKSSILSILESLNMLFAKGFQPKRSFYLGFGEDEETHGHGAKSMAKHIKKHTGQLAFVLDEGLVITHGLVPGVKPAVALIGIAEKGILNVKLSTRGEGGHASMPPTHTAIGRLSSAIRKVEMNPRQANLEGPVKEMFEYLGTEMGIGKQIVFSNLWLFRPLLIHILKKKTSTNAQLRTTFAVTMVKGGIKENVLPMKASAIVNVRVAPGDTFAKIKHHLVQSINDSRVKVSFVNQQSNHPSSKISSTSSRAFRTIHKTIAEVFPKALVAPSLVVGFTDSRMFKDTADNIYRFMPIRVGPKDVSRVHGFNERISLKNYKEMIQFYYQLFLNLDKTALSKK